jgi:subtilisin family serine protease
MKRILMLFAFCFGLSQIQYSQDINNLEQLDAKLINWYNLSPKPDRIMGASVDKLYNNLLTDLEPKKKIIVAVLDSGLDTEHEDLKERIWVNEDEIPENGIDDDNNGYIDDVTGWNFLGNSKGEIIVKANYEELRIYRSFLKKYGTQDLNTVEFSDENEKSLFLECKAVVDSVVKVNTSLKKDFDAIAENMLLAESILKEHLGEEEIDFKSLKKMDVPTAKIEWARDVYMLILELDWDYEFIQEVLTEVNNTLDYQYNIEFNPREIIGDNLNDIENKNYGNNKVKGIEAVHGTFVAGIIAGVRNNGVGIDGIAEYVEIMPLRVVPDGDEYDKDIALAIYYAVDNGANIINMSFGKNYSPNKIIVDDAMKYAEDNNVLLVHSAGNDAKNLDDRLSFPNKFCKDGYILQNWISVGASDRKKNKYLPGDFSNYSKNHVDLFAPGVDIVSTRPGNRYDVFNGTSFSSPVVSGVAALIWSYFPELTAVELKEILVNSVYDVSRKKVLLPYEDEPIKGKVLFGDLSVSGGIINAYDAFIMAAEYVENRDK